MATSLEEKPVKFDLKIDLVLHPIFVEGWVNIYIYQLCADTLLENLSRVMASSDGW